MTASSVHETRHMEQKAPLGSIAVIAQACGCDEEEAIDLLTVIVPSNSSD